jgi:hypothetical protein
MTKRGHRSVSHTLWPCSTCGAPGIRNVGTDGFCAEHLGALYNRFDPAVFALRGIGLPGRSPDPHDVTCASCDATWWAQPGEVCPWCARRAQHQLEHQAELLLEPPAEITTAAIAAWARRLATGVKAGLVDEATARRAILRAEQQAA